MVFNRPVENFNAAFTLFLHSTGDLALKLPSAANPSELFSATRLEIFPPDFYFDFGRDIGSSWKPFSLHTHVNIPPV
jgi:hypothetical protein